MAVIITNMKMPKSCNDCFKKTECFFARCNGWIGDKRDDNCPLKEVKVVDKCFDCRVNLLAKTKTNSVLEDIKLEIKDLYKQYLVMYNQLDLRSYFPQNGGTFSIKEERKMYRRKKLRERLWKYHTWRFLIKVLQVTGILKLLKK